MIWINENFTCLFHWLSNLPFQLENLLQLSSWAWSHYLDLDNLRYGVNKLFWDRNVIYFQILILKKKNEVLLVMIFYICATFHKKDCAGSLTRDPDPSPKPQFYKFTSIIIQWLLILVCKNCFLCSWFQKRKTISKFYASSQPWGNCWASDWVTAGEYC